MCPKISTFIRSVSRTILFNSRGTLNVWCQSNIVTVTNETPLDVSISVSKTFKIDAIGKLLIKYEGQTTLQSQRTNKSEPKSTSLTFHELKVTPTLLQTTHEETVINRMFKHLIFN